jgi:anti-sigma B factor antagonist
MDQLTIESLPGRQEGSRILKLTGPFTMNSVFDFQAILRQHPAPVTIIDLSDVPYMDSAALGSILGFHASCQRERRRYACVCVADRIKTLFKVSGVDRLIVTHPTVPEAEDALTNAA